MKLHFSLLSANPSSRRSWLGKLSLSLLLAATGSFALADDGSSSSESDQPRKKVLFFNRSQTFEHSVVKREGGAPSYAERIMKELAKKHGFEVTCTKDGTVFDEDYKNYDAFFFYTTGDLTKPGGDNQPPMTEQGKANLLAAVEAGKGFIGSHCASDTFHSPGNQVKASTVVDPYIQMLGGEFIRHGRQQDATMRVTSPEFPGLKAAGEKFDLHEEWYSLKNFAPDIHVILVQETEGMKDADYDRPPYPATWARKHGEGRVFYTSMGHREDVWTNPVFESILIGGILWTLGGSEASLDANLQEVTPEASTLPNL